MQKCPLLTRRRGLILFFLVLHLADRAQVVGRILVDVVVQPVLIQQVCVSTPAEERRLLGVVVGVIVLWHRDGQALADIPLVLGVQRVLVVLRVAGDEDLPSILDRKSVV